MPPVCRGGWLVALAIVSAAGGAGWMVHGARSVEAAAPDPARLPALRLAWRFKTGGRITGAPSRTHDGSILVASHDGFLYSLTDAGALRWKRALGGPSFAGAVGDDTGAAHVGSDGRALLALGPEGQVRFSHSTGEPVDTRPLRLASGLVVFGAGRRLIALDDLGRERWSHEVHGRIVGSPAVDSRGNLLFGAQDHQLHALDERGRPRWRFSTGADVDAAPVVAADGTIYVGSDDGHLYALSPDGSLRWKRQLGGFVRAAAAVGDGVVYVQSHGVKPSLHAMDAGDGRLRWSRGLGWADSAGHGSRSAPALDGHGHVFVGSHDGALYGLSTSGAPLWRSETDGPIHSGPLLGAGLALVGSDDGHLYAFRLE